MNTRPILKYYDMQQFLKAEILKKWVLSIKYIHYQTKWWTRSSTKISDQKWVDNFKAFSGIMLDEIVFGLMMKVR